jgi:ferric-dicitrate binding protein FerR (iron transport regulator)
MQQADIVLADGSHVRLAPVSTLTVPTDPVDSRAADRVVTLSGEAMFDVAPSSRTAFVVRAGAVSTRVLGTTFDISAYTTDPHVRVAVVSGKVVVGVRGTSTVVTAGTMARVADSTIVTTDVADMTAYTAWMDGTLVFRKAPVSSLLQTLGQWYGLRFAVSDSSITAGHITVTFDHKTQSEMLRVLADLLHVSMTFAPDAQGATVVTLHPQRIPFKTSRRDATLEGDMIREIGR